ncbi:MAG: OmpH family outer membrane protein [Bacteroidales bacterium]
MKNVSLYLNIVLIIAVALLYIDRFSGNSEPSENKTQVSGAGGAEIVYINIDSLLNSYDLYNELKTALIQEQQNLEANLNSKSKAYQRKAMEFQQKVEKRLVTQAQAEQMQAQLLNEQQSLMQLKDELSMQLAEREQNMNKQVFDKITSYLKKYNKDGKHKIIVGNTVTTVLEADPKLDITNIALKGLNQEYQDSVNTASKTDK